MAWLFARVILNLSLIIVAFVDGNVRVKRIVGGSPALIPPPITNTSAGTATDGEGIVFVYGEDRSAKFDGVRSEEGYYSFLGIRYAETPTGLLRLQRPVLLHPEGNITAQSFGSHCVQPNRNGTDTVGNEDCLYLNVYTPKIDKHTPLGFPVFFWIHGGGFRRGSGNQYGVNGLLKHEIVVVTINYRLGSLGWLGASNKHLPGNVGLFDVRAALEWTARYISYFGGDSSRIFVGGQGTGASIAMLLAQSPFTANYVRGVFAMSGASISATAVDYSPSNATSTVVSASECSNLTPLDTVRCLQHATASQILGSDSVLAGDRGSGFEGALSQLLTPGPVIEGCEDGRFLPYFLNDAPLQFLKNKKKQSTPAIPLLIGVTKHETSKLILGNYRDDVARKLAIPNYLNTFLPKSLLNSNIGLFTNGTVNKLLDTLFNNNEYLNLLLSTVQSIADEFEKVIEMTTDALFNLPAVTSSALWNKAGGNSYFYSFEYISTDQQTAQSESSAFLEGLPLATGIFSKPPSIKFPGFSGTTRAPSTTPPPPPSKPTVGHGDDLKYLFDKQTLDGRPIPQAQLRNSKDVEVKNTFTDIVAKFIKTGRPQTRELDQEWPLFEHNNSNYVAILNKPVVMKGFRICQMALWGGFVEVLQSSICKFPGMDKILNSIPNLFQEGLLADTTKNIQSISSKLTQPISGIISGGKGVLTGQTGLTRPSQQSAGGTLGILTKTADSQGSQPGTLGILTGGTNPAGSPSSQFSSKIQSLGILNGGRDQTTRVDATTTGRPTLLPNIFG